MKKRNLTINVDNWIEFNKEHLFRNMHNFLKLTQWHECVKELYVFFIIRKFILSDGNFNLKN